jgi:hypothetical protein
VGAGDVEVRAYAKNNGKLIGGIVAAGLGGGLAFIGGMLALAGGLSEKSGLTAAGGITAGVGLLAVGPGVYLIATSGSKAEIRSDRPIGDQGALAPGLGLGGSF